MNKSILSFRWILGGIIGLFLGLSTHVNAQSLVAKDDIRTIAKNVGDAFVLLDVLDNDIKPSAPNIDVITISNPKFGTSSISNFSLTYTPNTNFEGRDTIRYRACDLDNVGVCSEANIIFNVGKVPLKPTAKDDTLTLGQNMSKIDTVKDNDVLTSPTQMQVKIISNGKNGNALVNAADNIEYTPNTDFFGHDTVEYVLIDTFKFAQVGQVMPKDTAKLFIYVNKKQAQGNESGDTLFLPQASIKTQNILANNTDLENDNFKISFTNSKFTFNTSDKTFNFSSTTAGFDSVFYQLCDDYGQCVFDTLSVVVIPATVNLPPTVLKTEIRDTVRLGKSRTITIEATDNQDIILKNPTGLGSFFTLQGIPSQANVLSFNYSTSSKKTVSDTFNIQVCEVVATTSCSNVKIIVTALDTALKPIARDDYRKIKEDEVKIVDVLANDVLHGSKITSFVGPMHGTLDTTGQKFKYTPNAGYYGMDEISYTICRDSCDDALLTFEIEPVFNPKVVQGVSPNNDGINDVFTIEDVDYQLLDVSVKIFNRWGTPIFSEDHYDEKNPDKSWYGQSNSGEDVVDGTYFYIVEIPALEFKQSDYLVFISNK